MRLNPFKAIGVTVVCVTVAIGVLLYLFRWESIPTVRNMTAYQIAMLKDVESEVGVPLPHGAVLVSYKDMQSGRIKDSSGYRKWVVYSAAPIAVPSFEGQRLGALPVELQAEFVQHEFKRMKLRDPQSTVRVEWEHDGAAFHLILVRTPNGDYMVIRRLELQ